MSAGGFLFIAGQTAFSPEGELVGEGDAAAQTRQVFKNIGRILEGAGASFSDVVEFTTYLVGVASVGPFLEARPGTVPHPLPGWGLSHQHLAQHRVPGRLQGPGGDQDRRGSSRIGLTRRAPVLFAVGRQPEKRLGPRRAGDQRRVTRQPFCSSRS